MPGSNKPIVPSRPMNDRIWHEAEFFFTRASILLGRTRPWVIVVASVSFLAAAISFLVFFHLLQMALRIPEPQTAVGIWMTLIVYGIITAVQFLIGVHSSDYARRIRHYIIDPTPTRLDRALEAQLRYWRLVGFTICVVLALGCVIVLMATLSGSPMIP